MRSTMLMAILSAGTLFAKEQMDVYICKIGELPRSVVARAEEEMEAIFRAAGVQIEWKNCDESSAAEAARVPWFIIRLRNSNPPKTAGTSSLDAMGRAYIGDGGDAYLADAYFKAIVALAERCQADAGDLLGGVMAHEMGHLLLGPGHVPDGIMRTRWKTGELEALRQRRLQFNKSQRMRIQRSLRLKAEARKRAVAAR
jgi:hypothetical protein